MESDTCCVDFKYVFFVIFSLIWMLYTSFLRFGLLDFEIRLILYI